jgi:pimeloyl-ACP methyl ester carboxylesterase
MEFVTSADGTAIAYERAGAGHPIVFASGAFNDHHACAPVAAELADGFTVVTYDRRGRGESGDTRPYAIDREIEDLAALVEVVGGRPAVFGFSSGGLLGLAAARAGVSISALAIYEAPFGVRPDRRGADLPERLEALVDAGRAGDAVTLFQLEGIGLPDEMVAGIRRSPMFPALAAIARSTVYDATLVRVYADPGSELTAVPLPVLVMCGSGTWPLLADAARTLAGALPDGRYQEVDGGVDHGIPAEAASHAVHKFLSSALDR